MRRDAVTIVVRTGLALLLGAAVAFALRRGHADYLAARALVRAEAEPVVRIPRGVLPAAAVVRAVRREARRRGRVVVVETESDVVVVRTRGANETPPA